MLFDQTWSAVSGFWRSLGQGLPMQAEVLFVRVSWYSSCTCISNIWTFICTNSVLSLSVFFKMFLWNTCFFRHGNPHFKRKPRRRWHGKQIKTPFFVDECYTNLCFIMPVVYIWYLGKQTGVHMIAENCLFDWVPSHFECDKLVNHGRGRVDKFSMDYLINNNFYTELCMRSKFCDFK